MILAAIWVSGRPLSSRGIAQALFTEFQVQLDEATLEPHIAALRSERILVGTASTEEVTVAQGSLKEFEVELANSKLEAGKASEHFGVFIDILATDSTGGLVVIELKVSRGYDRVVGQLMRYMAWIRKNQADSSQRVRGVIVAREISEDLLLACSVVPDVELFEYQLSLSLKRVDHDRNA